MRRFTRNWRGVLFLTLGVAVVLAAHFVLDVCGDAGHMLETAKGTQVAMRCSWSERAIEGIGGLVAIMGVIMLFAPKAARTLSLATAFAGLLMLLVPIWLIPTCMSPTMVCNLSFRPGAILLSSLVVLAGLVGVLNLNRMGESA